tara:strand:+ start:98 stop:337 length:240 start_codon:yes stop_codon:yes gene_type:complete
MFKTLIAMALVCNLTDARHHFNIMAQQQNDYAYEKGFEAGVKAANKNWIKKGNFYAQAPEYPKGDEAHQMRQPWDVPYS